MNVPARYRKWFYIGSVLVMVGSIVAGIASPTAFDSAVDAATKVVALLAGILAALNVTPDE